MDPQSPFYSHEEGGRNRTTMAGLAAFAVALVAAVVWQAPWWAYLVVVPGLVLLAWMVVADPRSGCRLDPDRFEFWSGSTRQTVAVAEIARLEITEWAEGRASARLVMRHGEEHFVNAVCFRGAEPLRRAFDRAGVPTS